MIQNEWRGLVKDETYERVSGGVGRSLRGGRGGVVAH